MSTETGRREHNASQRAADGGWRFWVGFLIMCGIWFPILVAPPLVFLAFFGSLKLPHVLFASVLFVGFVWWIHFRYRRSMSKGADKKLADYAGFRRGVEAVGIGISGEYLGPEGKQ
jgi:hypothetical protein